MKKYIYLATVRFRYAWLMDVNMMKAKKDSMIKRETTTALLRRTDKLKVVAVEAQCKNCRNSAHVLVFMLRRLTKTFHLIDSMI